MEIVGRIETQLGRGVQQEGIAGGNNGQGNPGCPAVDRVLPLALRRDGIVVSDGDARKAVGGTATAADLVLGIRERGAEQVVHRIARAAVGVFGACGQGHRGNGARGRVVHPIDRDGDGAGRHQMVAGAIGIAVIAIAGTGVVGVTRQRAGPRAGIALVVVGDGDVETAVPVGRRGIAHHIREGDSQRLETRIDLGLGGTSNGDGVRVQASDRSTHSPHGRDSARAHGDRDLHGAGAVVVGIVQHDVGIGTGQIQRCGAFAHRDIAGGDLAGVVDGRDEQVARTARDVVHAIDGYRRAIGIERVGGRHCGEAGLLVVGPAIRARRKAASAPIAQPVVGHDLDLVQGVQVGAAQAGKGDLQAGQVGIDLIARTAQFKGLGRAVQRGVHRGTVAQSCGVQRNAERNVVGLQQGGSCLIEHTHCRLDGAVTLTKDIAVRGIHVAHHETGHRRRSGPGDGDGTRAGGHGGRIVDGGDGQCSSDGGNGIRHTATAHVAADGGGAFAEVQGQSDVARIAAVLVVVDVAGAGVVQAGAAVVCVVGNVATVEHCLDVVGAARQGDAARALAANGDGQAARRRQAARRARGADVQRAAGHRDGDGHGRAKGGGFGVFHHELVGRPIAHGAAHVFVNGEAGRAAENGGLVDAGCAQVHRGGGDVARGSRHRSGGLPVVGGGVNQGGGAARGGGLVQLPTVGVGCGCDERAATVAHTIVHNDFELVERVGIVGKGDGKPGQRRIHLGLGALELQDVVVAVLRDHHAGTCAVAHLHAAACEARRVIGDGRTTAALQAHCDLHKVSGCGRVGPIRVAHAEARHRIVARSGAVDVNRAGGAGHCRLVVGGRQGDEEDVVVRPRAAVFQDAIVDYEVEFIVVRAQTVGCLGIDFAAVVAVGHLASVDVRLREGGPHANRCAIEQQGALAGRLRDAELALRGGVVAVHRCQVGIGDGAGAALQHAREDVVDPCGGATVRDGFQDRGIGITGLVGHLRRVVDRRDVDRHRGGAAHVGLGAAAGIRRGGNAGGERVGGVGQIVAHRVAERDLGAAGISQRLAAVMPITQAGGATVRRGGQQGAGQPFAGRDRHPCGAIPALERAARGRAAIDGLGRYLEPQEIGGTLAGLAVQAAVDVTHAQVRCAQAHRVAIAFLYLRRTTAAGSGAVIGGRNVDGKAAPSVVWRAVADGVAEAGGVVFASVMDKADLAIVDILLGELAVGGNSLPACADKSLNHPIERLHGERIDGFRGRQDDGGHRGAAGVFGGANDLVLQHRFCDEVAARRRRHHVVFLPGALTCILGVSGAGHLGCEAVVQRQIGGGTVAGPGGARIAFIHRVGSIVAGHQHMEGLRGEHGVLRITAHTPFAVRWGRVACGVVPHVIAEGRVAHGELEQIGDRRTIGDSTGLHETHAAGVHVGLGKAAAHAEGDPAVGADGWRRPGTGAGAPACRAADVELNFALQRNGFNGVDQLVGGCGLCRIGRITVGIGNGQHATRDGGRCAFRYAQRRTSAGMRIGERGIVVVGLDLDSDGRIAVEWRCRAPPAVRDLDGVRGRGNPCRRIGFRAVLPEFELVDVGSGRAGQLGARRNRFPRIDHAVAVQVDEQRSLAAIVDGSELDFGGAVTHVAQVDGGRHPLDLAFDQARAAADGRRLVGGVDGDVDAAGGLRAAAVAHGDVEAVGIGRSEVAAVVGVAQAAQAADRDHLPHGHGPPHVAQRALGRQAVDDDHLLANDLLAGGNVHVQRVGAGGERLQRKAGATAFVHGEGRLGG